MSDLPTIEQAICSRTNAHCATCRDHEGGRAWRNELATAVILPTVEPDFVCPLGHPWGYVPAALTAAAPDLAAERLIICRQCDEWNGNVCERQFPRGKCLDGYMKWLMDPSNACPDSQW
jgi:hypothetical protein